MTPMLTTDDVAGILGMSPSWVTDAACAGKIPARKVGRYWRFTEADVTAYIESIAPATATPITRRRRRSA